MAFKLVRRQAIWTRRQAQIRRLWPLRIRTPPLRRAAQMNPWLSERSAPSARLFC
jgi:hypothetical protein